MKSLRTDFKHFSRKPPSVLTQNQIVEKIAILPNKQAMLKVLPTSRLNLLGKCGEKGSLLDMIVF